MVYFAIVTLAIALAISSVQAAPLPGAATLALPDIHQIASRDVDSKQHTSPPSTLEDHGFLGGAALANSSGAGDLMHSILETEIEVEVEKDGSIEVEVEVEKDGSIEVEAEVEKHEVEVEVEKD